VEEHTDRLSAQDYEILTPSECEEFASLAIGLES